MSVVAVERIPIGEWIESTVNWFTRTFADVLDAIADLTESTIDWIVDVTSVPIWIAAFAVAAVGYVAKGWRLAVFNAVAVLLIDNLEIWDLARETAALMFMAITIILAVGIPFGILAAEVPTVGRLFAPLFDLMQTLHPFVYLVPVVVAFGIGPAPAIVAAMIYTTPIPIRLTALGLQSVPEETVEAGVAFGANRRQVLAKVKLPLATPAMLTAVNQTILITLSFTVLAALIGAGGLGTNVVQGITRLDLALGFEAGVAIVLLAIMLDRTTRGLSARVLDRLGGAPGGSAVDAPGGARDDLIDHSNEQREMETTQ
jgi:glycine betaine/proline transport system permease protein